MSLDLQVREKERALDPEDLFFDLKGITTGRQAIEAMWKRCGRGWHGEELPVDNATGARMIPVHDRRNVYVWDTTKGVEIEMIGVPEGAFVMGSDDQNAYDDEKPAHTRYLQHYYMALSPITWKEYLPFCDQTKHRRPEFPNWMEALKSVPFSKDNVEWRKFMDHPVVNVSWHDCKAWCKWASLRLPTEAEWEKAARGTDARVYPWGDSEPTPEKCVWLDHPEYGGKSTAPVLGPDGLPVRVDGLSPYGAADMAGNVWEWCEDAYDRDAYGKAADEIRSIGRPLGAPEDWVAPIGRIVVPTSEQVKDVLKTVLRSPPTPRREQDN